MSRRAGLWLLLLLMEGCGSCGRGAEPTLPADMPENAAMRRERLRRENPEPSPSEPPPPQITSILDIDSGVAPTPAPKLDPRLVHRGFFDPVPPSETSTSWVVSPEVARGASGPSGGGGRR